MHILFLHQNMPGQFKYLAPYLAANPKNRVVFMTQRDGVVMPGVEPAVYRPARPVANATHPYLRMSEGAVLNGQAVVRRCQELARDGFRPDLIVAHPGWGESLLLKDLYPRVPLLNYCEFYYRGRGADIGFDPEGDNGLEAMLRARGRSAHLLLALEACDRGISPTMWQRTCHPAAYHGRISVIFDGIDTKTVRPDPGARVALPDGRILSRAQKVVTYVARNLEPYRGFPAFMRALPAVLRADPEIQVVVVGGDGVSYGSAPDGGRTWRQVMAEEVGEPDPRRVHFLGRVPFATHLSLLQISSAHVYLTYPFVLSWSCMEALAAGCVLIGSRTAPVQEVVQDGVNGLLVDFFNPQDIAARVIDAIRHRDSLTGLRTRARKTVEALYALGRCLPDQVRLLNTML